MWTVAAASHVKTNYNYLLLNCQRTLIIIEIFLMQKFINGSIPYIFTQIDTFKYNRNFIYNLFNCPCFIIFIVLIDQWQCFIIFIDNSTNDNALLLL